MKNSLMKRMGIQEQLKAINNKIINYDKRICIDYFGKKSPLS